MDVKTGDVVEIPSNKVDQPARRGKVEHVLDLDPLRLEVRWDDGNLTQIRPRGGTFHVVERTDG